MGGGNDEREQTLNQILVEMDGFEVNEKVIVMAATNRPDVLDPALVRPGRFDRRVTIDLPDRKDREDILKVHARKKPLGPDVKLIVIAERTPGFSGADLANLMNEAAILAAREERKEVTQYDLIRSIEKVMLGPERRSHVLNKKKKRLPRITRLGTRLSLRFCRMPTRYTKFQSSAAGAQPDTRLNFLSMSGACNREKSFWTTSPYLSAVILRRN